ncbi:acetylornithine aminotransferase [Alternaria alternata]|nr:acetylornithine aminotransferase [Alternaria alternata]
MAQHGRDETSNICRPASCPRLPQDLLFFTCLLRFESLICLSLLRGEYDDCRGSWRRSGIVVLRNHLARVELGRFLHASRSSGMEKSVGYG